LQAESLRFVGGKKERLILNLEAHAVTAAGQTQMAECGKIGLTAVNDVPAVTPVHLRVMPVEAQQLCPRRTVLIELDDGNRDSVRARITVLRHAQQQHDLVAEKCGPRIEHASNAKAGRGR